MSKQAIILVGPSLAILQGGDFRILEKVCAAEDPVIRNSSAYQQGRLDDCLAHLNNGCSFPSGLYLRMKEAHEKRGWRVEIKWGYTLRRIKPELVTDNILLGISLWDHQKRAILASLNERHGYVHGSTGSGKTAIIAVLALLALREYGHRSLILAGSKGTAHQFAEELHRFYGEGIDIGFIGDGRKRPGDITVAVPDTLGRLLLNAARGQKMSREDEKLYRYLANEVDLLACDESQRIAADGAYLIAMVCNAQRKIGFSGTPLVHKRLRDLKMIGATGPRLARIKSQELIDKGLSAKPLIAVIDDPRMFPESLVEETRPKMGEMKGHFGLRKYRLDYAAYYVHNRYFNKKVIVGSALWFARHKLPCLILCRQMKHFNNIRRLLEKSGVAFAAVTGKSPTFERSAAKQQFKRGSIRVLLASDIFSRGEDMPVCRGLVLAEGIESFENFMQRIGRGMRGKTQGVNEVWVVDGRPTTSNVLAKHADARINGYVKAGYRVRIFNRFSLKRLGKFFGINRETKEGFSDGEES